MMRHSSLLLLAVALLSVSCSGWKDDNGYSATSTRTLNEIVGFYSITSLEWDSPVDISGNGLVSSDILLQMKRYGFYGPSIHYGEEPEARSALNDNKVMMPGDTYGFGQVILYIPYFMHDMTDGTISPSAYAQKDGFCPVLMTVFQFAYTVDRKGDITFTYASQCDGESDGTFNYNNISVTLDDGCIHFESDTGLYDYNRGEFVEGRLSATYVKP